MAKLVYGVGIYDSITPALKNRHRQVWANMLERCYSDRYKRRKPTYESCTVCDSWLRFSNFRDWMNQQDWAGKSLDKDLRRFGNKHYSPETCCFISRELNSALIYDTHKLRELPVGVKPHHDKYTARINLYGAQKHLGVFDTADEAHVAYKNAKAGYISLFATYETDSLVHAGILKHVMYLRTGVRL